MKEPFKRVLFAFLKFVIASVVTFLLIGPISFFVNWVNNKDVPYALIVTVKSVWAVLIQAVAAGAAVFLFRIRGSVLDNEIARGRIKEKPLSLTGTVRYVFETGKINIVVYLIIAAAAMAVMLITKSYADYAVQALYNPLFFSSLAFVYIFGETIKAMAAGQMFGIILFPILYIIELYIFQRIRFKKFNRNDKTN